MAGLGLRWKAAEFLGLGRIKAHAGEVLPCFSGFDPGGALRVCGVYHFGLFGDLDGVFFGMGICAGFSVSAGALGGDGDCGGGEFGGNGVSVDGMGEWFADARWRRGEV